MPVSNCNPTEYSSQNRRNPMIRVDSKAASSSGDSTAKPLYSPKKLRRDRMGPDVFEESKADLEKTPDKTSPRGQIVQDFPPASPLQHPTRLTNRILRLPQVIEQVGLGRSTIYKLMESGDFPQSVKLGERAIGWRLVDIQDWIDKRPVA